jgi:glycerol-3-phosphate acyltransferase PlsY
MTTFIFLLVGVQAYLLGSIPFGLLVSRSQGIDIRTVGSGNIGATNVWRFVGRKWGVITFIADALKGWLAVIIGHAIASRMLPPGVHDLAYFGIAAAIGCIIGHTFPIWLGFRGGKGVATSLGVIFGMMPLASIIDFALWGIVFKVTGYVSLASIVAAFALPVIVIGLLFTGGIHGWANFYFACAAGLLVIYRHRDNIKRLVEGTEHRFGTPKAGAEQEGPEEPTSTDPAPPAV